MWSVKSIIAITPVIYIGINIHFSTNMTNSEPSEGNITKPVNFKTFEHFWTFVPLIFEFSCNQTGPLWYTWWWHSIRWIGWKTSLSISLMRTRLQTNYSKIAFEPKSSCHEKSKLLKIYLIYVQPVSHSLRSYFVFFFLNNKKDFQCYLEFGI